MGLKAKGMTEMRAKVKQLAKDAPAAIASALYVEANIELTEAKRRTPVWNPARPVPPGHTPGSLRASGRVEIPQLSGGKTSVTITFGNALVDYAEHVHEDPEAFHATGQWKYLESVLRESQPYMLDRIGKRLGLLFSKERYSVEEVKSEFSE